MCKKCKITPLIPCARPAYHRGKRFILLKSAIPDVDGPQAITRICFKAQLQVVINQYG